MKKLFSILTLVFALCSLASAQSETAAEVTANTQTLYLDRMGFNPNQSLRKVFNTVLYNYSMFFTEESDAFLSYELLVNGENYTQDKTSFFAQTLVSQVERIELITDNYNSSYGIGSYGAINVVLKTVEEGVNGDAAFSMDTKGNFTPAASISYKKDKWSVWGGAMMDYLEGDRYHSVYYYCDNAMDSEEDCKNHSAGGYVGMKYAGDKNILTFRMSGYSSPTSFNSYSYGKHYGDWSYYPDANKVDLLQTDRQVNTNMFAALDYKHIFTPKVSLDASMSFDNLNSPRWMERSTYLGARWGSSDSHHHTGKTTANVCVNIHPTKYMNFKVGAMESYQDGLWHSCIDYLENELETNRLSGYASANFKLGKWTLNIGERFSQVDYKDQFSNIYNAGNYMGEYAIDYKNDKTDGKHNIFNSNYSFAWAPNERHQLLVAFKTINTFDTYYSPSYNSKSAVDVYDWNTSVFNLAYAYTGKKISSRFDARIQYFPAQVIINEKAMDWRMYELKETVIGNFGSFGFISDISLRRYSKGSGDKNPHGNYFNFRINPYVNLPFDIKASATFLFQSIYDDYENWNDEYNRCWCNLRVAKTWKGFEFFVNCDNILGEKPKRSAFYDYYRQGYQGYEGTISQFVNEHQNQVTFGASYKF